MPNWQGLVSIYDEWIAVLFIFPAAERLRSTRSIKSMKRARGFTFYRYKKAPTFVEA
jgi:hypothetical protein